MPSYSQAGRSLRITTPLGEDVLLLVGFRGASSISQLFRFELDLLAEVNTNIKFEDILGHSVTVELHLANDETCYFNGILKRFSQGLSDDIFTTYHAEVVPKPWLLTKTVQSRIFQNMSVPDILNRVLTGCDFTLELSGEYYPRNYCVQYRESDFDFASRLMEDEGIYYFFQHTESAHKMVVSDAPTTHPELPLQSTIIFEQVHSGVQQDMRVRTWEKAQELRSAKYTVRDYCFEMPTGNLQETNPTVDQVKVGAVTHKLNLAGNQVEIYEYPGGYAKRYDAVDSSGSAYAQGLTQMVDDRSRIVRVRMEEEECAALEITGGGDCGNFAPGYTFKLQGHPNGDGEYLLTRVEHNARQSGYRTGEKDEFSYDNRFVCIPTGLTYRPPRVTPKPVIEGVQTATVTGPPGQSSSGQSPFVDQYGRIKVHFHWDRQGQMNSNSSCWLRVGQIWAGNQWGAFFWPRAGQEVIVAFEDGDPDRPIVVGSVYNAANMPPYALPANSALGGIRSASVGGNSGQNFNGVVFNDTLGKEHLSLHSENNMSLNAEKDKQFHGGGNKGERIYGYSVHTVGAGSGSGGGPEDGGSGGGGNTWTSTPVQQPTPVFTTPTTSTSSSSSSSVTKPFDNFNPVKYNPDPAGQTYAGMDVSNCYGTDIALTAGINQTWVLGNMSRRAVSPLDFLNDLGYLKTVFVLEALGIAGGEVASALPFPEVISEAICSVLDLGVNNYVCAPQTDFIFGKHNQIELRPPKDSSFQIGVSMTQYTPLLVLSVGLVIDALLVQLLYLGYMGETDDSKLVEIVKICNDIAGVLQLVIKMLAEYYKTGSNALTRAYQAVFGAKRIALQPLPAGAAAAPAGGAAPAVADVGGPAAAIPL
jgi:type VI secretion system secreted protein VgrG